MAALRACPGQRAAVEHDRLLLEDEEALDLLAHAATLLANADAPAPCCKPSRCLGSPPFLSLAEAFAGSRPETSCADWCRERWHDSMRTRSTAPRGPSSSRFRPVRGRIAWQRCCAWQVSWMPHRLAYDTVSRAAFLTKLCEVAPALVPYVRAWYGGTST